MAQAIRLWEIQDDHTLREIPKVTLDLEERLLAPTRRRS